MCRVQLRKYNSNFGKVLSFNDIMKMLASSGSVSEPHRYSVTLNRNFIVEFEVHMVFAKMQSLS